MVLSKALSPSYPVDNVQLVDGDLSVGVVTAAEDVVDEAGAVQAGLDDDKDAGDDDHASNDTAPPGGIVAKLIKD